MKRGDEQHGETETVTSRHGNGPSNGGGVSESEGAAAVTGVGSGEAHAESVTVLVEGGGFSFNDVFPMESRSGAAQCGREIATYALSLVARPLAASRRRRSPVRQVEE